MQRDPNDEPVFPPCCEELNPRDDSLSEVMRHALDAPLSSLSSRLITGQRGSADNLAGTWWRCCRPAATPQRCRRHAAASARDYEPLRRNRSLEPSLFRPA